MAIAKIEAGAGGVRTGGGDGGAMARQELDQRTESGGAVRQFGLSKSMGEGELRKRVCEVHARLLRGRQANAAAGSYGARTKDHGGDRRDVLSRAAGTARAALARREALAAGVRD